jgi:hypothetical protein
MKNWKLILQRFTRTSQVVRLATLIAVAGLFLHPTPGHTFYSVHETGELLKPEEIQLGGEVQFVTNRDEGVNLIGRADKGFRDDMQFRLFAGSGTTDAQLGALLKWVPFPDTETQPAVGFDFGFHWAHYDSNNELALRAIPFVSKKFVTETAGDFSPFAALPLALRNYDDDQGGDDAEFPVGLVLGSRYHHKDFEFCDFSAELGFNLAKSPAYFSVNLIFPAWILEGGKLNE